MLAVCSLSTTYSIKTTGREEAQQASILRPTVHKIDFPRSFLFFLQLSTPFDRLTLVVGEERRSQPVKQERRTSSHEHHAIG